MHGELPFPEATATTEILVAGEAGGKQAKILAVAAAVGGLFDFLVIHFGALRRSSPRTPSPALHPRRKAKLVFRLDVLSAVLGLGYIIGLRYSVDHLRRLVPVLVRAGAADRPLRPPPPGLARLMAGNRLRAP